MNTMQTFDDVVTAHAATVLRMCASLLGPGPDAEDAAAETFLAALTAHPFAPGTNVEAWLVRVARNKSVDVLRAHGRVRTVVEEQRKLRQEASVPEFGYDDELWTDVATLTPRQQFVVAHRFIAQWTYPEIADELGCTAAAARRTGSDAIAALRRRRSARDEETVTP